MEPRSFRRLALVAWLMQALIVVSGAAVRLTEAGLGCEDWPTCNQDEVLPEWELHGWIEFGNRLISLLVAVSAIALFVGARRRLPRRTDLIGYAAAVLAGTVAQVVLGGITVLLDLHPAVVGVHFLLSMALLYAAQTLWLWAADDPADAEPQDSAADPDRSLIRLQLALATVVLFLGTIVTGTGPNSGDSRADRLGFDLESVARLHSVSVWVFVAVLVALALRAARAGGGPRLDAIRWLVGVAALQGILGYVQFALGVPAALVELHIVGAITVWTLAIAVHHSPAPAPVPRPAQSAADLPEWSA